jgi:hypothetical protein
MTLEYVAQAVLQARRLLCLPASDAGSAWHVRRLAAPGAYFLVHVEEQLVCLEAASGALMTSGRSRRTPVSVSREAALTRAALGADASIELVWKPCAASMSMFDPLWLVTRGHDSVFVDQRGKRWSTLPMTAPG